MTLTNSPVFAVCMMAAGFAAGMVWYAFRLKKNSLPVRAAVLAAAAGSVLALLFAKAGFLLHDLGANIFEGYYDEITEISAETLSFVGGCLGIVTGVAAGARASGIKGKKALDIFAAPGCVFLCLARLAEGGMDTIGTGSEVEASWLKWFPLAMQNSWEEWYLCVFFLEALWALICLIPALGARRAEDRDGDVFARTSVWLLSAQIGFEMYLQYPFIRPFLRSFVSLDQVMCAILLVILAVTGCVRNKKRWPVPAILLLLGLNAFLQFYRDNKITFLWEAESLQWFAENAVTVSRYVFFLISAALIPIGLKAISSPGAAGEKAKI